MSDNQIQRPPTPTTDKDMEIASDWYSYGYASGMEAERKWGAEASAALSAQPQPEAVEAVLPAFKPCFSVNEPMNLIEVAFEDASYTAKPLIDGVYHWIDQHIAHDDGRVVGLTFWMYKPPLAPDARMRRVLERIRDDGPDHGVRWCRNIASEALRADEPTIGGTAFCGHGVMASICDKCADEGKESEGGIMAAARKAQQRVETWSDAKKDYAERTVGSPSDPTPAEQREAIAQWLFERFMQGHAQWCEMSEPNKDDWRKDADAILALSTRAGG